VGARKYPHVSGYRRSATAIATTTPGWANPPIHVPNPGHLDSCRTVQLSKTTTQLGITNHKAPANNPDIDVNLIALTVRAPNAAKKPINAGHPQSPPHHRVTVHNPATSAIPTDPVSSPL
jgi:hypothetical protein